MSKNKEEYIVKVDGTSPAMVDLITEGMKVQYVGTKRWLDPMILFFIGVVMVSQVIAENWLGLLNSLCFGALYLLLMRSEARLEKLMICYLAKCYESITEGKSEQEKA